MILELSVTSIHLRGVENLQIVLQDSEMFVPLSHH